MASTERIFFAGVATSAVLIGAGFGGGILVGQAALEPAQPAQTALAESSLAESSLAPARVVLPALTEAAPSAHASESEPLVQATTQTTPEPQITPQTGDRISSDKTLLAGEREVEKKEQERQEERRVEAKKKKNEAASRHKKTKERERRNRFAEKKAREEAAREQQRAQERRQEAPKQAGPFGMLAFDENAEPPRPVGFFGD